MGVLLVVVAARNLVLSSACGTSVARGAVLVTLAGCVLVLAYGVSAVVGAALAPTLMPRNTGSFPVVQPLACLFAAAALLPAFLRAARMDWHCLSAGHAGALERRILVQVPTRAMGLCVAGRFCLRTLVRATR